MEAVLGVTKILGGFLQARSQRRAGKAKARALRAMSKYNQRIMERNIKLLEQKKDIGLDKLSGDIRDQQGEAKVSIGKSGATMTGGVRKVFLENARRNAKKLVLGAANYNLALDSAKQDVETEAYQSEMKAIGAINDAKRAARSTLISSITGAAGNFSSAYGDMKAYNKGKPEGEQKSIFSF